MIPDGTYLVKYRWVNPMKKDGQTEYNTLCVAKEGKFNLFNGAEIVDYISVQEVWKEEERVNNIARNGNCGLHYEEQVNNICLTYNEEE